MVSTKLATSPGGSKDFNTEWITDDPDRKRVVKRARRKAVSQPLASALFRVTKSRQMKKAYRRTMETCGQQMTQSDGTINTNYCGYRWCLICSSIRTARAISAYGAEVQEWESKYLVTLTIPNCSSYLLRPTIKRMTKWFRRSYQALQRKHGKIQLVRSTEITYSQVRDDFHPHFHVIVKDWEVAHDLVKHWLKRTNGHNSAQDIRKADNKSVLEVFKYATKLATDTKTNGKRNPVPAPILDEIFSSIRGLRLLAAVGMKSRLQDELDELELQSGTPAFVRVNEFVNYEWFQEMRDWVDLETGELLSHYEPTPRADDWIKRMEEL